MAEAVALTARKYDDVPYVSLPVESLQPSRLEALARLHGLKAASSARARVLEIGCASGGHIIPLAAQFPEATFLGIDVSPVQIAEGLSRIARTSLANIRLETRSFTELETADGAFDYIICHGVYSWITEELSESLLHAIHERLAPDGIAAISYNVLPGWRIFQVVRDSVLLQAATGGGEKVEEARRLLHLMADKANADTSYGRIWNKDAQRFRDFPDAYLLHELFEENNAPVTFTAFAEAAARHGLAYLSEAQVISNIPENAGSERGALIRELGRGELRAREQATDIVTGRTFRQSLVIHDARAQAIDRSFAPERFERLHFVAPLELKVEPAQEAGKWSIRGSDGWVFETGDEKAAEALRRLITRLPASSCIEDIADRESEAGTVRVLMQLLCCGELDVSSDPISCANAVGPRPKVWPLAAGDAAAGFERTATLRHKVYKIAPPARVILPLADGSRSVAEIGSAVLEAVSRMGIEISQKGVPVTDRGKLAAICLEATQRELANCARQGLLVEEG